MPAELDRDGDSGGLSAGTVGVLQAATRVLAGVALRSLDAVDSGVTLPQFRVLAVLEDLGRVPTGQVARALGLDASTVTRLADRLVSAGHVVRGEQAGHRGVVTLELTASGRELVWAAAAWRERELARILGRMPAADRAAVIRLLGQLVEAAGTGYGLGARSPVPL